jgi:hypothetical protein
MNVEKMSPPEIDGQLAKLYSEAARLRGDANRVEHRIDQGRNSKRQWNRLSESQLEELEDQLAALVEQVAGVQAQVAPFNLEFQRRGGWSRYYLVNNPGGHVHSSRNCSSCFPSTEFLWLVEHSGLAAEELVELAGERACSVCFPWAPVSVLQRASRLAPDVAAQAERAAVAAERAVKAAAKDAKAISAPDGSPLRVDHSEVRTVVSAWREAVGARASQLWYPDHPSLQQWSRDVEVLVEALAFKLDRDPVDVLAEVEKKAQAKHRRDVREGIKNAQSMFRGQPELRADAIARLEAML